VLFGVGLAQCNQPKWRVRALVKKATNDPDHADAYLEQALAIDSESPEALAASAESQFLKGDWTKAADLYERYLAKSPGDWQAEGHLGCAELNAGRSDQAITHLQKLRSLDFLADDSRYTITNVLAAAFLYKNDTDQTLELIKTLPLQRHNLDPHLQESLLLRALAHYQLGQRAEALKDLDRLYALNFDYPSLLDTKEKMKAGTYGLPPPDIRVT